MVRPALLLALIAGCGDRGGDASINLGPDAHSGSDSSDPPTDSGLDGTPPDRADRIQRLRDGLMRTINDSPCPGSGCEMVSFQPVPAAPSPTSEGARVLLIDEAIVTVAATRFQSRTLAYLTRD